MDKELYDYTSLSVSLSGLNFLPKLPMGAGQRDIWILSDI